MSTPADMTDCECRNSVGYPNIAPITRPFAKVEGSHAPSNTKIEQNTDNSTNKPMPWVALACLFGGLGFGAAIILAIAMQGRIEAEGRAVRAEVRAEFSERFAAVEAQVEVSKYEASLAKTIAQRLDEKDKQRSRP